MALLPRILRQRFAQLVALLLIVSLTAQPAMAQSVLRDAETEALLRDMADPLVEAAGLRPGNVDIVLINDPSINAFVAGGQVVYIHSGLLNAADTANEVQGVIAHELSHIGNRDTLLMTAVVILAGLVSVLSDLFLRMQWFGGRRSRDNDREGQNILFLIGIVVSILAPFAAMLIRFAISRRREFLADANAVLITRYPEGLASALEKIRQTGRVSYRASAAIDHLYFTSPFGSDRNKNASAMRQTPWYVTLFSTHPPIEQRIAALKNMAQ